MKPRVEIPFMKSKINFEPFLDPIRTKSKAEQTATLKEFCRYVALGPNSSKRRSGRLPTDSPSLSQQSAGVANPEEQGHS
mmetsp:Transcript_19382/g.29738  ORF Transcript_19382/g.29738 Transcript_19382/m.29738 type:complete len:80 (+) Transcript_19382:105-344(+)